MDKSSPSPQKHPAAGPTATPNPAQTTPPYPKPSQHAPPPSAARPRSFFASVVAWPQQVRRAWRLYIIPLLVGGVLALCALAVTVVSPPADDRGLNFIRTVLHNCNPFFATTMVFSMFAGTTYLIVLCFFQWIPSSQEINIDRVNGLRRFLDKLGKTLVPPPKSPSGTCTSSGDTEAALQDTGIADTHADENQAKSDADPAQANPTTVATSPSEALPTGHALAVIEAGVAGVHPWIDSRVRRVLKTLVIQGPDSARADNQAAAASDETAVAIDLVFAQICEWILPLLGFLGTVWGLHKAIPPLSEGLKSMMKALGEVGEAATSDRTSGLTLFNEAFSHLRTAFDTTMVGLFGVICVGLVLHLVRRRAASALSTVSELTEAMVASCPVPDPVPDLLQRIREAIAGGLLQPSPEPGGQAQSILAAIQQVASQGLLRPGKEPDRPEPILAAVQQAVQRGLMHLPKGQKDPQPILTQMVQELMLGLVNRRSGRPLLEEAPAAICQDMRVARDVLAGILRNILREERAQTLIQWYSIAPDVRVIRKVLCGMQPDSHEELIQPTISTLATFDDNHNIQALAIANSAAKICVAGLVTDIAQYFVSEIEIEWASDHVNLSEGIKYRGRPVSGSLEADAPIAGLCYGPKGTPLLVMSHDGEIRGWFAGSDGQQMKKFQLSSDIATVQRPFLWLDDTDDLPLVCFWELGQDRRWRIEMRAPGAPQGPRPSSELQQALNGLSTDSVHPPNSLRIATHQRLLALACNSALSVAELRDGNRMDLRAHKVVESGIIALDISADVEQVVYGLDDGSVFAWHFQDSKDPVRLFPSEQSCAITGLFIGPGGDQLAVVSGPDIFLYELNSPEQPVRRFDLEGANATHLSQSLDRGSLVVATDNNVVKLFTFSIKLPHDGRSR